jgi:hypothetical protein
MSTTSLAPGEMRFHQWCEPPLVAGQYRLEAVQSSPELEAEFATALDFVVDAPRFALLPTDVYSVYPPKGQAGDFGGTFPHIVLSRRTLPWERTLEPRSRRRPGDTTPWLALLTVSAADFGGVFPELATRMISELLEPGAEIAGPTGIKLSPHENPQHLCASVDLPASLFSAIAPSLSDLALLAHVREVNTGAKETAAYLGDGWHSVVVGNRLPRPDPGGEAENRVYLVSLEGMAYALPPFENPKATVRLAVLSSWGFRTRERQGFKDAATNLQSDALRLQWDETGGGDEKAMERVQRALRMGYIALNHATRLGEKTVSWYRGPLIPVPSGEPVDAFYPTADAALGYVPEDGMFEVSHAASFQLGRLLGLQSRHFAQSLQLFRRQMRSRINQVLERYRLKDTFSIRDALSVKNVDASALLQEVFVPGRAGDGASWSLAPARSISLRDDEKGLSLVDDFDIEIPEAVSRWLARLVLLYRVPFVYLVPDQGLLEKDWIRFFCLDRNWIQHLLEGACSVGRSTSRDELADARLRRNFMNLALEQAMNVRREARPEPVPGGDTAPVQPKWPLTGFLMRSPIVEGWQGLEMRAWEDSGDKASIPLAPLRIDRIAPDILLCIFNGRVGRIEIKQPPEGLHFGLAKLGDGFGKTHFRDAAGVLRENHVMATMRNHAPDVLDVASFAKKIVDALQLASSLASSDLAMHMIERPGRLIFDRAHPAVP